MIRREATKRGDKVKVTFVLGVRHRPDAVFVAGDFNSWNAGATRMRRRGESLEASVMLCAGRRYAFRYFSSGQWFNDESADADEPNEFGGSNSILDLHGAVDVREPEGAPPETPPQPSPARRHQ